MKLIQIKINMENNQGMIIKHLNLSQRYCYESINKNNKHITRHEEEKTLKHIKLEA